MENHLEKMENEMETGIIGYKSTRVRFDDAPSFLLLALA